MRYTILIFLICIISYSCFKDKPARQLYVEEFEWKIEVPKFFDVINPDEWDKSKEYLSEGDSMNTLVVFKRSKNNYFESNYHPYRKGKKEFIESCKYMNNLKYLAITSQFTDVKVDSFQTIELIDSVEFVKFEMDLKYSEYTTEKYIVYEHLFDTKAFSAYFHYRNERRGKEMLRVWRNSTFGKPPIKQ